MSKPVSIWGVFPDQLAAGEALHLLECGGFGESQIAIDKRFREAVAGIQWAQAMYVRLPEGIIAGFAGGGLLCAVISLLISRGIPPLLPTAFFICLGMLIGTVLGAFTGMLIARFESMSTKSDTHADGISIGVFCFDQGSEQRAKKALQRAGAAAIDTIA